MAVQKFDRSVLKVVQVHVMGLNLVAFLLGFVFQVRWAWVLAPVVGALMIAGVVNPELNYFRQLYLKVLKPRAVLQPRVVEEDPTPHQFANAMGGSFLLLAGITFALGATALGWVLVWMVIFLAFLNFAFEFCAGCQVYFLLQRTNLIPRQG